MLGCGGLVSAFVLSLTIGERQILVPDHVLREREREGERGREGGREGGERKKYTY